MHVLSNARRRVALCLIMLMIACLPAMALAGYASREVELSDEGLSVPPLYQDWTYKLYHSGPAVTVLKERLQALGQVLPPRVRPPQPVLQVSVRKNGIPASSWARPILLQPHKCGH